MAKQLKPSDDLILALPVFLWECEDAHWDLESCCVNGPLGSEGYLVFRMSAARSPDVCVEYLM